MSSISVIESGSYLASRLGVSLVQANRQASASEQSLAQRAGIDSAELSLEGKSYLLLQDKVDDWNTLVAITQIQTSELDALAGFLERYSAISDPAETEALEQEITNFLATRVNRDAEVLLRYGSDNDLALEGWGSTRLLEYDAQSEVDVALLEVDLFGVLFSAHPSDGCPICQSSLGAQGAAQNDALWDAAPATNSSNLTGATTTTDSGISYIEPLRKGPIWDLDAGETLSYSYYTGSVPYTYGGEAAGAAPMSAHEADLDLAFAAWETATPFAFQKVTESGTTVGEIRMAYTNQSYAPGAAAFAYYPNSGVTGGDNWYIVEQATNADFALGTYGFITALHEIGHAIGLSHPFAEAGRTQAVLTSNDNQRHTVMTYTQTDRNIYYSVGGGGLVSARTNASTPGVYDVAAIEYMYGAITDANTGNTVYSYGDWNPDNPFLIRTLVDSGGTDTIDASSQTRASIIDLSPGSFSSIGIYSLAEQQTYFRTLTGLSYTLSSAGSDLYTGEDNLGIAFSATIENAYGGAGNDTITGNTADNTLRGNGGNDTIDGGAGTDVAVFSRDYSEYSITESGGTVTVTHNGSGADGTDTLTNIEFIDFADKRYTVGTGELARAGGLVIPVKEGLFSSERQAARLQQAREELNAGRPVLAPRPPSAKAKYLSRLAEARQKQFGKDNEITPTQTLVSPRSESVAMSPAHVSGQSPPSSSQIAMAVRVTAAQKAVLAGIQATLENQAPQILGGSNLSTPKANEIARTIKLLNSPNLVALKAITAPEVRAMLL